MQVEFPHGLVELVVTVLDRPLVLPLVIHQFEPSVLYRYNQGVRRFYQLELDSVASSLVKFSLIGLSKFSFFILKLLLVLEALLMDPVEASLHFVGLLLNPTLVCL